MSCAEIRWWLAELRRRGWREATLGHALGAYSHIDDKARGTNWIYPSEQIRFSHRLHKIIAGEIVIGHNKSGLRQVPMLAAHPVPIPTPMKMVFDMKVGRCRLVPQVRFPENPLPIFSTALDNPPKMAAVKRGEK